MKNKSYYYTPEEWSRSIGYGQVPEERLQPQPMTDEPYPPLTADQVNQILDELKDALSTPSLLPLPLFKHFLTKIFFASTSGIEADTWLL
jgi:hypothetical protein